MQNPINPEIRDYETNVLLGMSMRQTVCAGIAIGIAAGTYFAMKNYLGMDQETASWVCIVLAFPVAAAGFFRYHGMNLEQFLWAWFETCFLRSGPRVWIADNAILDRNKIKPDKTNRKNKVVKRSGANTE